MLKQLSVPEVVTHHVVATSARALLRSMDWQASRTVGRRRHFGTRRFTVWPRNSCRSNSIKNLIFLNPLLQTIFCTPEIIKLIRMDINYVIAAFNARNFHDFIFNNPYIYRLVTQNIETNSIYERIRIYHANFNSG